MKCLQNKPRIINDSGCIILDSSEEYYHLLNLIAKFPASVFALRSNPFNYIVAINTIVMYIVNASIVPMKVKFGCRVIH